MDNNGYGARYATKIEKIYDVRRDDLKSEVNTFVLFD